MRPYPVSVRQQVAHAVLEGRPVSVVARAHGIARSTLARYLRQFGATGTLAPRPPPGRPRRIRPVDHPALAAQLAAFPAATLAEHSAHWERAHHVRVSRGTMAQAIARIGYIRARRPEPLGKPSLRPIHAILFRHPLERAAQ
ncbi:MAG: helix-turn-helix domain-containing protein [Candidatus Dormibacteraceae bacterium]